MRAIPMSAGARYGCWTVLEAGVRTVLCRCDCGTEKQVWATCLRAGTSLSCGCIRNVLDVHAAEIERLYAEGRSQSEIAQMYGVLQAAVWNLMRRRGIAARPASQNHGRPPARPPKGTSAGYRALHDRVRRQRGTPSRCEECGTTDQAKRYEWANLTGRYDDPSDYARMCVPCHRSFDTDRRTTTGQRTSPERKST